MRLPVLFLMIAKSLLIFSCDSQGGSAEYPGQVGDITFNEDLDDAGFQPCNDWAAQYYNFGKGPFYAGGKAALMDYFQSVFQPEESTDLYITIRFMVNCKGEAGRFRVTQMNMNYEEVAPLNDMSDHLLALLKNIPEWEIGAFKSGPNDYYQYLTFKIVNGELKEILP